MPGSLAEAREREGGTKGHNHDDDVLEGQGAGLGDQLQKCEEGWPRSSGCGQRPYQPPPADGSTDEGACPEARTDWGGPLGSPPLPKRRLGIGIEIYGREGKTCRRYLTNPFPKSLPEA